MFKTIQILTNLDCNLRCKYCYEHSKTKSVNKLENILMYIDAVIKENEDILRKQEDGIVFEFIGGEPFLHIGLITKICDYIFSQWHFYNFSQPPELSFSTNGTLLTTKEVQDFFIKYGRHCNVGISIDGTKEIHDSNRVDIFGCGTYDRILPGITWLKQHVCNNRISVKATYNHDTFKKYDDGVINLINLGFTEIGANVVFEEIWTKEDGIILVEKMCKIIDYLIDNNLENIVHIFQINSRDINFEKLTFPAYKTQNHCGTCQHMRCLGYDGIVYGCHRFATMNEPIGIGYLENTNIAIDNQEFINEVSNQFSIWPDECKSCGIGMFCPSCSAIPYEVNPDNPSKFFEQKGQCGFTMARATAMLYLKEKLIQKKMQSEKS